MGTPLTNKYGYAKIVPEPKTLFSLIFLTFKEKTKKIMKKIPMYLVILLFTANVTSAQTTGILSSNFQETVNNPNPYMPSADENTAFRKNGTIPQGITQFHNGITRADAERFGKEAGDSATKFMKRALVAINSATEMFVPKGQFTTAVFEKNSAMIEQSIKCGVFDFKGQTVQMTGNVWAGSDLVSRIGMVDHLAVGKLECFYFDFPTGKFPFAKCDCFNGLGDNAVLSVFNKTAEFIADSQPAATPGPNNTASGNTAGGNTSGGFTPEQIIALASAMKPNVLVIAGNNNGNNNGVSGAGLNGANGTNGSNAKGVPNSPFGQGWTPVAPYTPPSVVTVTPATVTAMAPTQTATVSTVTSTSSNQLACTSCQSAWNTQDVAFMEKNSAQQTATQAKLLRQSKAQTGIQATGLVLQTGMFIVDQLERTGVIRLPNQRGNVTNLFTTASNNTTNSGGGPADFPNGGCPVGTTWNGIRCQ